MGQWHNFVNGLDVLKNAIQGGYSDFNQGAKDVFGAFHKWPDLGFSASGTDPQTNKPIQSWDEAIKAAEYLKANPDMAKQGPQTTAASSTQTPEQKAVAQNAIDQILNPQPMVSPLATQLFFSHAIAPMLQGLAQNLGQENAGLADAARQAQSHFQMPESYKAIFGQAVPRMQAGQNDIITSLLGAAASGPALDQLMQNITAARTAQTKAYYELLNQQALGALGGGLPGVVIPGQQTQTASSGG